ncbi:MAG: hypothetical protein FIB05_00385, partial [Betaproteobacteria bacterium]|nr:hypothetical protein [Betaproteobacteria bacterium]
MASCRCPSRASSSPSGTDEAHRRRRRPGRVAAPGGGGPRAAGRWPRIPRALPRGSRADRRDSHARARGRRGRAGGSRPRHGRERRRRGPPRHQPHGPRSAHARRGEGLRRSARVRDPGVLGRPAGRGARRRRRAPLPRARRTRREAHRGPAAARRRLRDRQPQVRGLRAPRHRGGAPRPARGAGRGRGRSPRGMVRPGPARGGELPAHARSLRPGRRRAPRHEAPLPAAPARVARAGGAVPAHVPGSRGGGASRDVGRDLAVDRGRGRGLRLLLQLLRRRGPPQPGLAAPAQRPGLHAVRRGAARLPRARHRHVTAAARHARPRAAGRAGRAGRRGRRGGARSGHRRAPLGRGAAYAAPRVGRRGSGGGRARAGRPCAAGCEGKEGAQVNRFFIGRTEVGGGGPPALWPDIDVYFKRDAALALRLVDAIREAGIATVKTAALHDPGLAVDGGAPAQYFVQGRGVVSESYREVVERHAVPLADLRRIFARVRERGLDLVVSVYDEEGIALAVEMDAAALKIPSSNIVHAPLIRAAASAGRPLVIDTGRSTMAEIGRAVAWARRAGAERLLVQHSPP